VNILLFGATGMVGDCVLRWLIASPLVNRVVAVSRKPLQVRHPRLESVIEGDMFHLQHTDALQGFNACFFCLGASSVGMSAPDYRRPTFDLTLAVARQLLPGNPRMVFEFISGEGTDPNSRQTWARVKAETEAALFAMGFHDAYALRPGFIQLMRGSTSREGWMRWLYAVTAPFYPFLQKRFRRVVTLTDLLGRGDGAACHHRQREEDPEYSRPERCCKGKPLRIVRRISVHTRGAGIVSASRNALVRRADTDRCKDRGVRPDREQGAHEHEAKEHDLPLVRQGRA
jgi:hypothetical protein